MRYLLSLGKSAPSSKGKLLSGCPWVSTLAASTGNITHNKPTDWYLTLEYLQQQKVHHILSSYCVMYVFGSGVGVRLCSFFFQFKRTIHSHYCIIIIVCFPPPPPLYCCILQIFSQTLLCASWWTEGYDGHLCFSPPKPMEGQSEILENATSAY